MTDLPQAPGEAQRVQFHYLKSPQFRTVTAEGFFGSVTPHGKIYMAPYTERGALPRVIWQAVSPHGELGEVLEVETRGGVVRELEVGIIIDRDDAVRFRDWLSNKILELDAAMAERKPTGA